MEDGEEEELEGRMMRSGVVGGGEQQRGCLEMAIETDSVDWRRNSMRDRVDRHRDR